MSTDAAAKDITAKLAWRLRRVARPVDGGP